MNDKKIELVNELRKYAEEIRCDWSGFDGRDNLQFLDLWLAKLCKELGIDYHSYYEPFWPGAYQSQLARFKEVGLID